jgi:hypothetical protein
MESQNLSQETFRRSWLTVVPELLLAGSVSLSLGLAAQRLGMELGEEATILISLPLVWAAGRTLQWAARTWTATSDGRLIVREGVLRRTRRVIHLCSARQVRPRPLPVVGRWGVGHVAFEATDPQGQLRPFHWPWMADQPRLCQILQARGQIEIGRPSPWAGLRARGVDLARRLAAGLARGAAQVRQLASSPATRRPASDYGRFLAFCHHLLRSRAGGRWPPCGLSEPVVGCWMAVLRRARVVVDAPNGRGWRLAGTIHTVADIQRRIGQEELRRAVGPTARQRPGLLFR